MSDREYPHPRVLLERLDADDLRNLAHDFAHQLAAVEIARERKARWPGSDPDHSLIRNRAAKLIAAGSTHPKPG